MAPHAATLTIEANTTTVRRRPQRGSSFRSYPSRPSVSAISSSTLASSIVAGVLHAVPSAIERIVARRIFPERVFGSRSTTATERNAATGPISSRTRAISSASISAAGRSTPAFRITNPTGSCPFSSSATPVTAHSATSGWFASASSIAPVERRCPATLMTSSVRAMTNT